MKGRNALGRRGEAAAEALLVRRGYRILERNARSRYGEIDLIAEDGSCLVFVEVKTRRHAGAGTAEAAVTAAKQRRVARLARHYLAVRGLEEAPCRFDVVAVAVRPGRARLTLVRDAFRLR